jgi:hypothetical protein
MAKKKAKPKGEELSKDSQAKKDLLQRIRDRRKVMKDADEENRRRAEEDLRFVNIPGEQWDANMKKERGDRPCLEANTLRINGKRVINEIRANRPQGHVRAVEGGDKEGAELREGLVRNILNISDFDTITDQAAEYQVDGGFGAWRVNTEYADDSMWDQDIIVKPIKDPLNSLWWDPACEDILLKRDAADWLLEKSLPIKAYEEKYGEAEKFDFDDTDGTDDWEEEETVRVVEYWYKEPYNKELWLIEMPKQDGSGVDRLTVDSTSDEAQALTAKGVKPVKTRSVRCHKIMMCLASGKSILEGPVEIGGSQFPFVVVFGEVKVVDRKVQWWGLHRFSKDAQQIQNIFWTSAAESVAAAPKTHTWASTKQAEGLLPSWAEAHRKNLPVRLFNPDPAVPGAPTQHSGAQVPVAMLEMVALSSDLVRTTSGLHEASFGEESNEKSGVALARKQNQAQIVTYNFPDNMAKGAKRTGEIILDRIPIVYDAERELRVLGVDGAEDYKRVNQLVFDPASGKTLRVNDLTAGKYDFYVKAGPSYSSMREEASEIYGEFVQKFPDLMGVAGDLIFKASDLPYSDEIAKRLQTLLPPPIQKQLAEGKEIPPEAQAVMAQAEQAMAMVQQQTQLVQQAAQEVQNDKAASDVAKANVEKAIANLKTEEARFDAKVAKAMAQIAQAEAGLTVKQAGMQGQEADVKHRETRLKDFQSGLGDIDGIKKTIEAIDGYLAQYIEAAEGTKAQILAEVQKPKPKRKIKAARTRRDGGNLFSDVEFDDGTTESFQASREGGNLVAVPVAAPTQPN